MDMVVVLVEREWEIDVPIGFSESFQNDRLQEARHYSGCCPLCSKTQKVTKKIAELSNVHF